MSVSPTVAPFIRRTFYVTGEFGEDREGTHHKGLDIATISSLGPAPLYSIINGRVIRKDYDPDGWGYYLIIKGDDGPSTLYGHMNEPSSLNINDRVRINQFVGYEGESGYATGLHTHVEMQNLENYNDWQFGADFSFYMNPASYMNIPNVLDTECYYDISPAVISIKRKFKWVLYANKIRNLHKIDNKRNKRYN